MYRHLTNQTRPADGPAGQSVSQSRLAIPTPNGSEPALADDVLEGAAAIATFIWGSPDARRKVYHLAKTSRLPVFRYGSRLCMRKSKLEEWINRQENRFEPDGR